MTAKPLFKMVEITPPPKENVSAGGIIIANPVSRLAEAEVIAVGEGVADAMFPHTLSPGDKIIYSRSPSFENSGRWYVNCDSIDCKL